MVCTLAKTLCFTQLCVCVCFHGQVLSFSLFSASLSPFFFFFHCSVMPFPHSLHCDFSARTELKKDVFPFLSHNTAIWFSRVWTEWVTMLRVLSLFYFITSANCYRRVRMYHSHNQNDKKGFTWWAGATVTLTATMCCDSIMTCPLQVFARSHVVLGLSIHHHIFHFSLCACFGFLLWFFFLSLTKDIVCNLHHECHWSTLTVCSLRHRCSVISSDDCNHMCSGFMAFHRVT